MINNNLSGVFQGNVLGAREGDYEDPSMAYEEQANRLAHNGELRAFQPINFEDKIMGGRSASNFMRGKFPELPGLGFNQRVNQLTGKGGGTMEEQLDTEQKVNAVLSSQDNPVNKVNAMLGGMGTSSGDKMNMLLGGFGGSATNKMEYLLGGKKSTKDISAYLGNSSKNKSSNKDSVSSYLDGFMSSSKKPSSSGVDVISRMLGERDKKKTELKNFNFDMASGFGKRAFAGLNMNTGFKNAQSYINGSDKKTHATKVVNTGLNNPFGNIKNTDAKINNMFRHFGNPENTAKTRIAQQKGLPMFGDFDGDRLINMLDCDPLDPTKQGEQHNLQQYTGMNNVEGVSMGNSIVREQPTQTEDAVTVSSSDAEIMNALSPVQLLSYAQENLKNAKGTNERKRWMDIIKNVSKSAPSGQGYYQFEKESKKLDFEREKYAEEKAQKIARAKAELGFAEQKFEYGKERDAISDAMNFAQLTNKATQDEFSRMRQEKLDEKADRKEERAYNLKLKQLNAEQGKNDMALWETKLRAGTNMLGGLIGGNDGQSDVRNSIGTIGGTNINNPGALTGGMSNSVYSMAESIGEFSMQRSFGSKVAESVGSQGQMPQSFASKVNDSVGNRKAEEVIAENRERQQMAESIPQQIQQPVQMQPPAPIPQYQPQYQRPSQMGSTGTLPVSRPPAQVDWDYVSPEQASQVDPQYARYLAESQGETTYRRGPYRKNR